MADSLGLIAVVDDDDGVRDALGQLLRAAEYEAVTFGSAEDFLSSPALTKVDCLVADVNLPGMSGVALLSALVGSGMPLPTILITARDDLATRELIHQVRAVPCLRKPFSDDELFEAIRFVRRGGE